MYNIGDWPIVPFGIGVSSIFEGYGKQSSVKIHLTFFGFQNILLSLLSFLPPTGSFHYHACAGKCEWGGHLDLSGIFVLVWSLIVGGSFMLLLLLKVIVPGTLSKRGKMAVNLLLFAFMLLGVGLGLKHKPLFFEPYGGDVMKMVLCGIFGLLMAVLAACVGVARHRNLTPRHDTLLLPMAVFSLLAAVLAWLPEEVNGECPEAGGLELHAIWHSMLGASIWSSLVYFRALGRPSIFEEGLLKHMLFAPEGAAGPLVASDLGVGLDATT